MKDLCLESLTNVITPMIYWENHRQIRKWGVQEHEPATWMMILSEEHGELAEALLRYQYAGGSVDSVIKEAIHTATLAVKIAEMLLAQRSVTTITSGDQPLAKQILGE